MHRFSFLLIKCSRSPLMYGCMVLLLATLATPLAFASPGASYGYDEAFVSERLGLLEANLGSGVFDSAPDDLRIQVEREAQALRGASQSTDLRQRLVYLGEYYETVAVECEHGYVSGTTALEQRALSRRAFELARMDNPELYDSSAAEPALYYLPKAIASTSPLPWFLAAVAACLVVLNELSGFRLAGALPTSGLRWLLDAWTASFLAASLTCALGVAPLFILACVRNGVGDPSYPVVFLQGGEMRVSDLGGVGLGIALLVLGSLAFVCAVVCGLARLGSPKVGLLAGCLLGVFPSAVPLDEYIETLGSVAPATPLYYFDWTLITGHPFYFSAPEITAVVTPTAVAGFGVLVAWTAMTCALFAVVGRLASAARIRGKVVAHADGA